MHPGGAGPGMKGILSLGLRTGRVQGFVWGPSGGGLGLGGGGGGGQLEGLQPPVKEKKLCKKVKEKNVPVKEKMFFVKNDVVEEKKK